MKDKKRFASTMLSLSLALKMFGRDLDEELQLVYWRALEDLSDDEFERAAAILILRETEFPQPALFLEVARPKADGAAEAFRLMCKAWFAGKEYDPESGSSWSAIKIRAALGEGAYEAFHACGGSEGFRLMDDDYHGPGIRRAFADSYQRVTRADPRKALPQPGDQLPALTSGEIIATAEAPGDADWRSQLWQIQKAQSAGAQTLLMRPQPLPCSAEEQAVLDRIGEKLAAKRAALVASESGAEASR